MKINKHLLVGLLAIGVAVQSKAGFLITGSGTTTATVGNYSENIADYSITIQTGGDTIFDDGVGAVVSAGQTYFLNTGAIDYALSSSAITSAIDGPDGLTLAAGTYTIAVEWTLSTSAVAESVFSGPRVHYGLTLSLDDNTPSADPTVTVGYEAVTVFPAPVGVPEPAQTIAGAMLMGCGSLVFAGRRLLKKPTA